MQNSTMDFDKIMAINKINLEIQESIDKQATSHLHNDVFTYRYKSLKNITISNNRSNPFGVVRKKKGQTLNKSLVVSGSDVEVILVGEDNMIEVKKNFSIFFKELNVFNEMFPTFHYEDLGPILKKYLLLNEHAINDYIAALKEALELVQQELGRIESIIRDHGNEFILAEEVLTRHHFNNIKQYYWKKSFKNDLIIEMGKVTIKDSQLLETFCSLFPDVPIENTPIEETTQIENNPVIPENVLVEENDENLYN